VELTSADVTALVCADTGEGSYAFRCPECEIAVSVEAELRIVDLLVDRGVTKRIWSMPAEMREAKSGPRLQYDDLLDLHFVLQRDGWFAELEALTVNSFVPLDELAGYVSSRDGLAAADDIAEKYNISPWIATRALALAQDRRTPETETA
jgi:hypothetical protein